MPNAHRFATSWWLVCLLLSAPTACLRDLPDLPPIARGGTLTATLVGAADAQPLPAARVEILGAGRFVYADSLGRVRVDGLPLGTPLRLTVRPRAADPRRPEPVALLTDAEVFDHDGQLVDLGRLWIGRRGGVRGRLVDGGGRALAGGLVYDGATGASALSDAQGVFVMSDLAPGRRSLVGLVAGVGAGRADGIRVEPGATTLVDDLVVDTAAEGGPLLGRVRTADGAPVANARVRAVDLSARLPALEVRTGSDGRFGLTAGPSAFRVLVLGTGLRPARIDLVVPPTAVPLDVVVERTDDGGPLGDLDDDGCPDAVDVDVENPWACADSDGDGRADEEDDDLDGDGLSTAEELSPGLDGVITRPDVADSDGDGVGDARDVCPTVIDVSQLDGDHDGRGDACDLEPRLDRLSPTSGGVGTRVRLDGARLVIPGELVVVELGGVLTIPEPITSSVAWFRVPRGASSGRVRLLTPRGVGVSASSFDVVDGPTVLELRPTWVVEDGEVEIIGTGLSAGGLRVSSAGVELLVGDVEVEDASSSPPRERVRVRTAGAATGPVRVETVRGVAESAQSLDVVPRAAVRALTPNPAARGGALTVEGQGLSTLRTGGVVSVEFPGGARARAELERDDRIVVTVPIDAEPGPLVVHHPTGPVTTAPLALLAPEPSRPRIDRLWPTIAEPGQSVRIEGAGLAATRAVRFVGAGGRVPAASFVVTAAGLEAVMPSAGLAGTIEVLVGTSTLSTSRLRRISRRLYTPEPLFSSGQLAGFGYDASGSSVRAVDVGLAGGARAPRLWSLDGATLGSPTVIASLSLADAEYPLAAMQVAPSGDVAVVVSAVATLSLVVDLATGAVRGRCADRPARPRLPHSSTWSFDAASTYAYAVGPSSGAEGVLRVRLSDGRCDVVGLTTPAGALAAVVATPTSPPRLLVSHRTLGLGRLDPTANVYTTTFGGPASSHQLLYWEPDGLHVWGLGGAPTTRLEARGAGANPPIALSGLDVADHASAAVTRDGRWLVASRVGTGTLVIDLVEGALAADALAPDLDTTWGVVAHPTRTAVLAPSRRGGAVVIDFEE
jgi:hypothetical protein